MTVHGREINVTANEGVGDQSNPPIAKPAGPTKRKDRLIIQTACSDESVSVIGACSQICKFLS